MAEGAFAPPAGSLHLGHMLSRQRTWPVDFVAPCLPCPAEHPPIGPGWIHEIKHDGYRLLACRRVDGRVRLFTRNGNDWSERFPAVLAAIGALRVSCLMDGEAVAYQDDGL